MLLLNIWSYCYSIWWEKNNASRLSSHKLYVCSIMKMSFWNWFLILCSHLYRVAIKKPVGILHVNVVRALKLLKMDLLGTSDPYVKLSMTGEKLPAKKTTVKRKNLNPVWNEKFKLIVKDPQSQVLQLQVYDWDKVFPIFYLFEFWLKKHVM